MGKSVIGSMKAVLLAALAVLTLAGCGHTRLTYIPEANAITRDKAVSIVEQGFYEDYGKQRPESVHITDEMIILSDGVITKSTGSGALVPIGNSAAILGSSSSRSMTDGQRIYFRSLGQSTVHKKKGRDNRYAVLIRMADGATLRRVFFRSEAAAKQFVDAIETLRVIATR